MLSQAVARKYRLLRTAHSHALHFLALPRTKPDSFVSAFFRLKSFRLRLQFWNCWKLNPTSSSSDDCNLGFFLEFRWLHSIIVITHAHRMVLFHPFRISHSWRCTLCARSSVACFCFGLCSRFGRINVKVVALGRMQTSAPCFCLSACERWRRRIIEANRNVFVYLILWVFRWCVCVCGASMLRCIMELRSHDVNSGNRQTESASDT